jgi:hypothetical protein
MNITLARANRVLSSRTRASTQVAAPVRQPMSVGVICEDLGAFPIYRTDATRWKKADREVPLRVFLRRRHLEYGALLDG